MKKSLDKMVEYAVVFDGKPLYAVLEAEGFRGRVASLIEDILARFGDSACDRITVLRHSVESVAVDKFVTLSRKEATDVE